MATSPHIPPTGRSMYYGRILNTRRVGNLLRLPEKFGTASPAGEPRYAPTNQAFARPGPTTLGEQPRTRPSDRKSLDERPEWTRSDEQGNHRTGSCRLTLPIAGTAAHAFGKTVG